MMAVLSALLSLSILPSAFAASETSASVTATLGTSPISIQACGVYSSGITFNTINKPVGQSETTYTATTFGETGTGCTSDKLQVNAPSTHKLTALINASITADTSTQATLSDDLLTVCPVKDSPTDTDYTDFTTAFSTSTTGAANAHIEVVVGQSSALADLADFQLGGAYTGTTAAVGAGCTAIDTAADIYQYNGNDAIGANYRIKSYELTFPDGSLEATYNTEILYTAVDLS